MNEDEGTYTYIHTCRHPYVDTLTLCTRYLLVENRGLGWGDDYLFNLDNMQRCNGSIFSYLYYQITILYFLL